MFTGVGSTDNRWDTAGWTGERKRVCKTLSGLVHNRATTDGNTSTNLITSRRRKRVWSSDDKSVEIDTDLKSIIISEWDPIKYGTIGKKQL